MKKTKVLACVLTVAMAAGLFAGCSKTTTITTEKFTKACEKLKLEEFDLEDFYAKDSNELGSTRTKSFVEDMQVIPLYDNGKQSAPVYMGMKPDFLK